MYSLSGVRFSMYFLASGRTDLHTAVVLGKERKTLPSGPEKETSSLANGDIPQDAPDKYQKGESLR